MALSEKEVRVGEHVVRYRVAGEGEPVVLVHGLAGSTRWWARNVNALAERHRVLLVDLPGFGMLGKAEPRFVLAEAALWLRMWMEAVGLGRADLFGHSMGGYICIKLAAHEPEAVQRLVLVAPAGLPSGRSRIGHITALTATFLRATPSFIPLLVHDALRAGPTTIWRAALDLLNEDVSVDLASIAAPTLLIWGQKDSLVPPSLGYIAREEIPNSRLLLLKGAGHVPMYDRPKEFNKDALAFLAGKPVGD